MSMSAAVEGSWIVIYAVVVMVLIFGLAVIAMSFVGPASPAPTVFPVQQSRKRNQPRNVHH